MFKDRVINIDKYRPFATILGSLRGIRNRFDMYVSKEEVQEVSESQAKQIKDYMDRMSEDVSGMKLIDLFDPEFLDSDAYDDGLVFTQYTFIDMRNAVKLLRELGISPNRTVGDINECNRVVSNEILQYAMVRLVSEYQEAINNHDLQHPVVDTLEKSVRDQVVQIVTPDFYLRELGVDVPEDIDTIFGQYEHDYNEFVDGRVSYILSEVMDDIEKTPHIVISGLADLKGTLRTVFSADEEFLEELNTIDQNLFLDNPDAVLNKTNGYLAKLPTQDVTTIKRTVADAYMAFIDKNKLGDVDTAAGKKPLMRTIALVDIILHAFVLASADVWDVSKETEEELDSTTNYVISLINAELSERLIGADEDVSVSEFTAYKMLSAVSVANDLIIARNAMLRWRMDNSWGVAISALDGILLQMFKPERYEEKQKAFQEGIMKMQQQQMM